MQVDCGGARPAHGEYEGWLDRRGDTVPRFPISRLHDSCKQRESLLPTMQLPTAANDPTCVTPAKPRHTLNRGCSTQAELMT